MMFWLIIEIIIMTALAFSCGMLYYDLRQNGGEDDEVDE